MTDIIHSTTTALTEEDLALLRDTAGHAPVVRKEDKALPWFTIVQAMSPYMTEGNAQYLEAARPGMIIDTVSMRLRKRLAFCPSHFEMNYTEWKMTRGPTSMVKQYFTDDSAYKALAGDFGPRETDHQTEIVPSYVFFGIGIDEDGQALEGICAMTGTQAKKARKWLSLIDLFELPDGHGGSFKPAVYAKLYGLTTVPERNDQGSWFGWRIEPGPMTMTVPNGRMLFNRAKDFRERIDRNEVRAVATPAATQAQAETRQNATREDQIPF